MNQPLRITRPTHLRNIMTKNRCIARYSHTYGKLYVRLETNTKEFLAIKRNDEPKFDKYVRIAKELAVEFNETTQNIYRGTSDHV